MGVLSDTFKSEMTEAAKYIYGFNNEEKISESVNCDKLANKLQHALETKWKFVCIIYLMCLLYVLNDVNINCKFCKMLDIVDILFKNCLTIKIAIDKFPIYTSLSYQINCGL